MANMPETVRRRMPIATFALIGISVLLAIIMFCATGSFNPDPRDFIDYGANFRRLTFGGQLWRLVTSSFLHFGLEHLAFNMLCLFALGKFLEKMVGHANLLCVYLLTACTGGILSMCFHDNTVCAGASGAVFGVFGASISLVALLWRKYQIDPKYMWGYMKNGLAFVGINFIYSLFPGIDMAGHIGGLLGGLVVGGVLALPLLLEGNPFGTWFQRGFWGMSALLSVILACTTAVGGGPSGGGRRSSSRSGDEDDDGGFARRKVYAREEDQPSPTAVLEDEQRKADTLRHVQDIVKDVTTSVQRDMAGSIDFAVRKIRSEAERGDAKAQCKLAWCYLNGHGVKKDLNEAVRWYRKAAEQGDTEAQAEIGDAYRSGIGVSKNLAEAVRWYRKAALQGHVGAQQAMGVCFLFGEGVAKDEESAVRWLKKAAVQGHAYAQYLLGECFENGWGIAIDVDEAINWYRKAAKQGLANAQSDLGVCYLNGKGVRKDEGEAFRLFSKAAAQGFAIAQNNIGACYANGWAVAKNDAEAVKWYRKAAEQGLALAQRNLGACYLNGQGVVRDVHEAKRWLRKAAQQGDEEAVDMLNAQKRKEMLRTMSLE